jgi:DNA-binding response OmpR family regulator
LARSCPAFLPPRLPARSASVHNPPSERQNLRIARPKILVATPHPGIGAGLATLLALEGYEVSRIARLAERSTLGEWRPDAVLVDAALLTDSSTGFGAPTLVLAGSAADGERLAQSLPDARGWLPKDVRAAELRRGLGLLAERRPRERSRLERVLPVVSVTLVLVALGYAAWVFLRPGG